MHRLFQSLLPVLTGLLIVSCSATPEKRIAKNPHLYAALPASDRAKVVRGEVDKGMSREAVFIAWGNPDRVQAGEENGKELERWGYLGSYPVTTRTFGVGLGYGYGGWGGRGYGYGPYSPFWMGGGPTVSYIPYEAAMVEFKSGKVSSWRTVR